MCQLLGLDILKISNVSSRFVGLEDNPDYHEQLFLSLRDCRHQSVVMSVYYSSLSLSSQPFPRAIYPEDRKEGKIFTIHRQTCSDVQKKVLTAYTRL